MGSNLLALDLETNALVVSIARPTQIGVNLYSTEFAKSISSKEDLTYQYDYPPMLQEAEAVSGISADLLKKFGKHPREVLKNLLPVIEDADFLVGHNCTNFDKPILEHEFKRHRLELPEKVWLDTSTDLKFAPNITSRRLIHLAVEHGIQVDISKTHSALYDATLSLELLLKYDLNETIERAKSPMVKVIAEISREKNDLVKRKRFMWDPEKRVWHKTIKEFDLQKFLEDCNFKTHLEK